MLGGGIKFPYYTRESPPQDNCMLMVLRGLSELLPNSCRPTDPGTTLMEVVFSGRGDLVGDLS